MSPVVVVAEIGINHNGSVELALEMVREAAKAGVDACKTQHFSASEFCTAAAMYKGERQVDLFRRYELTREDLAAIAAECRRCGVVFFGTPDSVEHARDLIALGAPWVKVGSDDLTNLPLLKGLAALGKSMILSTGMGTQWEIEAAIDAIRDGTPPGCARVRLSLMHCVSRYPTPPAAANIERVCMLRVTFDYCVGYSDHTDGIDAAPLAIAFGATMIEKHFTLDRGMEGPDHAFSADPQQFAEMVRRIRVAEQMLGSGEIDPGPEELEMRKVARRSVVAAKPIRRFAVIREQDLACKRPGTGLEPKRVWDIVGRLAQRDIVPDEQLREGDWA